MPERILIVGAGGFGREVLQWARDAWPESRGLIRGFLAADFGAAGSRRSDLPIVGDPATFDPAPGDALVLAIGIPGTRRRVAERLLSRGARFLSLMHPSATVAVTASIGTGAIVCPHAVVSDSATVGPFAILNYHSSVAHDAAVGEFAVLSPYATLGGGARIAADAFLGLHATVGPDAAVGAGSKVAANSCALHDVPPNSLVHGVPGRVTRLIAAAEPSPASES